MGERQADHMAIEDGENSLSPLHMSGSPPKSIAEQKEQTRKEEGTRMLQNLLANANLEKQKKLLRKQRTEQQQRSTETVSHNNPLGLNFTFTCCFSYCFQPEAES